MLIREVLKEEKEAYNRVVNHPLQSWEWGDFRAKTGVEIIRLGVFDQDKIQAGFQITLHNLPKINYRIGYMPKSPLPDINVLSALKDLCYQKKLIFIKFEPNFSAPILGDKVPDFSNFEKLYFENSCVRGRPLFTKYSFMIDLKKTEEELLAQFKPKTRYNIKVAQKYAVEIVEDNSSEAFEDYLKLMLETTKRQGFFAHTPDYHRKMWQTLQPSGIAHLLKAQYNGQTLVTWIVFVFDKVLYYPYGASSSQNRQVMASNLMMWEAIKFGKKLGCTNFDLWGSLGPKPDPKDPWIGFHTFKEGYGPTLMEFIGSFDYVYDQPKYKLYNMADNLRWKLLKLKAKLPL